MALNVAANTAVGFGPPLMLTVLAAPTAAEAASLEFTLEPALRMVKRGEMACIPPCVLLMKRR